MIEAGAADSNGSGRDVVWTAARAFERDRYLAALLSPRPARDRLIALAAFAGEAARIPAFVREPMIGQIRLHWWRDAVAAVDPDRRRTGHPIADAVATALRDHPTAVALLHGFIDAHERRLEQVPFATFAALEAFLDATEGAMFRLADLLLSRPEPRAEQHAPLLVAAGRGYGLARLLIEHPATLAQGRVLLPADRLAAHGLTLAQLTQADRHQAARALLNEVAERSRQQLADLRRHWPQADRAQRRAVLPIALIPPYLKVCEQTRPDPLEVQDVMPITRVVRLWLAARLGVV